MSREYIAHSEMRNGYRIEIVADPEPESPRQWCESLGVMKCRHRRYNLGDKDAEDLPDEVPENWVVLDLYLYDHSGITMATHPFSCPWDSGKVGVIYATSDKIKEWYGEVTKETMEKAMEALEQEVKTYDQFLTGQVWGYRVMEGDEEKDSCWGFYQNERPDAEDSCVLVEARARADALAVKTQTATTP